MNQIVKPSPRIEAERQQRRRREDTGLSRRRNLAVSGEMDPNFTYRWVNDDPGRMHALTVADDWEVVVTDQKGPRDVNLGTGAERIVDRRTGKRAVLLRKRKDYYVDDKRKEQAQIDETEKSIKRGQLKSETGQPEVGGYVPQGAISVSHGGAFKP